MGSGAIETAVAAARAASGGTEGATAGAAMECDGFRREIGHEYE